MKNLLTGATTFNTKEVAIRYTNQTNKITFCVEFEGLYYIVTPKVFQILQKKFNVSAVK